MRVFAIHIAFLPILLWLGGISMSSSFEASSHSLHFSGIQFHKVTNTGEQVFSSADDHSLPILAPIIEEVVEEVELDESDHKSNVDSDQLSHFAPILSYGSFKKLLSACQVPGKDYHSPGNVTGLKYILFQVFRI